MHFVQIVCMAKYRPNVAALMINSSGRLLVCERMNQDGAWQFPQGGMDKGETPLESLYREVEEEVGWSPEHYEAIEYIDGYRYDFPAEKQDKKGFDGQQQTYFICQLKKGAPKPNLKAHVQEFQDYKWIRPKQFQRKWIPEFKRAVYESVMWDFFDVELKD